MGDENQNVSHGRSCSTSSSSHNNGNGGSGNKKAKLTHRNSGDDTGNSNDNEMLLDQIKRFIYCPVCKDRRKSHIISRSGCFHIFCKECVDELMRNRSRKCPLCKKPFDKGDIHPVNVVT